MFTPEESVFRPSSVNFHLRPFRETERDWDKDLAEDVKGECEQQYGKVDRIKVEKESQVCVNCIPHGSVNDCFQGEIYVKFSSIETAEKAAKSLNGRWFGGKQVSAHFISDAIMQAHQW